MKEFEIEGRKYFLKDPTNNSVLESEANIYSARIFAKLVKAKDEDGEHIYYAISIRRFSKGCRRI
jgi:hypothetical protein